MAARIAASSAPKRRVLAFFREDTPSMARALVLAGLLISTGGFFTLLGGLSRQLGMPVPLKIGLGILGSLLLLTGLLRGFVVFPSVLWRERSLAVEREGLRFTWHDRDPEFYRWDQIERCEGQSDALVLHFEDRTSRRYTRQFGGKNFAELAELLEGCRRKAQFSLL